MNRFWSGFLWLLYALVWLSIVVTVCGGALALVAGDMGLPDWAAVIFFAVVAAIWVVILHYRLPLRWLLYVLGVLFFPLGLAIVTAIGVSKFIIEAWGRRNVFAASRMTAGRFVVAPRGLVRSSDDV